ncbi:PTS fructose transporter subunit IIA [Streptomyces sp. NPDC089919]|uniref:PTS-dependent dihydroxyacetone kinase phosphotransferase subunit DhaM n=1 Tax=Streptomyces sp. NPDC089919 TaxID=3155188 RepID=UPI00344851D0
MEALRTAVDSTDAEYADTGCGGGCGGSGCKGAGCSGTRCGGGCADAGATPAPAAAEPAAGTRGAARTETPRVGVVLVSHSKAVAESVAELSRALLGGAVSGPLAVAGGTADGSVGTSAELVLAAARQVDEGLGVAVLCDMGSAVLTLKSLVGDPASGLPGNTRIVDAPFLEGAVAITLTAAVGGDLEAVLAAAEDARSYRKV